MTILCTDLRCERLVDPIGIGTAVPRLTWRLEADGGETDVVQEAWEVETVLSAGSRRNRRDPADKSGGPWSTGRREGWRQQFTYDGPALGSRSTVRWRVRGFTSQGSTEWSPWATFETGILDPSEWRAAMITAAASTPVVRFSTTVDVPDDVVGARLRVTAQGIVVAEIDGQEVGDEVLAPGWTSYHHRLPVRTHDATSFVADGGRGMELAATVAPGWFSGRIGFDGGRSIYGTHVGAFLQLELQRADGSLVVVGTDETWTASSTPWSVAGIYEGETFDHRAALEPAPVTAVADFDPATLYGPAVPPIRRTEELRPVSIDGDVIDFGQNLVGWLRLRLRGLEAGTEVVLRHAEVLDGEGRLFTAPLRTADATDRYVASGGDEVEVYEPRFTFHGFRYASISGVDRSQVEEVVAVVVHSDLEPIGTFACSDPLLERLHENVRWGWRGNSVSVPTDCPQRDERLGWTGDAQVFSPTASFLTDAETFWESWLADLAADQLPSGSVPHVIPDFGLGERGGAAGWGDAAVVVPWTTYVAYGDDAVLRQALPSMRAWVEYVASRLDEHHHWRKDFQFGDWLDPDAPTDQPWRAKAKFDLVATAHAAYIASLLARAAAVVGDEALASWAGAHAAAVRDAWWRDFGPAAQSTQAGAAIGLAFDLAPDEEARLALGDALALRVHEADDHLATGFLGTPALLPALTATGHLDIAYAVLLQRTAPSWLYQVLAGATTIWERWDALRPDGSVPMDALGTGSGGSMVSFNHYAYGAVADWLHTTVAGLRPDPDDPGYHHVLVAPRPGGGLTHASASLRTRYGPVSVAWRLEREGLRVEVSLPPNTTATVSLPDREPVRVGSGDHRFGG